MNEYEDLYNRLDILKKYCSEEYTELYRKLRKVRDKAISMDYLEYRRGGTEHTYSNLWSCVYNFKKENNVAESMEKLMQLMKDIDFNIDRQFQVHNFKVEHCLYTI